MNIKKNKIFHISEKNAVYSSIIVLICFVLVLFNSLFIKNISAYFLDADQEINSFKIDKNEIIIEEEFQTPQKGEKTVKRPMALNVGETECYVRARIILSDSRAKDYINYYCNDTKGFDTSKWKESTDGWLYYADTLKVSEKTVPVFTHIQLLDSMPDIFMGCSIDVIFESVQSEGFKNAQEAFGALGKEGGV